MCDGCRDIIAEHLLDYVNLGLHLEVAIRMEREALMTHALMDNAGQEAIEMALGLAEMVNEVGAGFRLMERDMPSYWAMFLADRKVEAAREDAEP